MWSCVCVCVCVCVCACNASELVLWLRFLGSKRSEYIVVWCVCVCMHIMCVHIMLMNWFPCPAPS